MKITLDLPGGGRLELERKPMDKGKFEELSFLLFCLGVAAAMIIFAVVLVRSFR